MTDVPKGEKATRAIPYHNILWAVLSEFDITIHYAHPRSKNVVRAASLTYPIDKSNHWHADAWVSQLFTNAYGESQRAKRIKVLVNPAGGKGNAQKLYTDHIRPIFSAARCRIEVERTQYRGHAVEIAENLDIDAYDVVAACSGDGLPHEVFNGLGRRQDARRALSQVAVVQLPCGSGNALSWNLTGTGSPSLAALSVVKGIRSSLDLISITQGNKRTLSFLSQSFGIIAESDLDTEHLRWMGSARFTYGYLTRLARKSLYPCEVAFKVEVASKAQIRENYRKALSSDAHSKPRPHENHGDTETGLPPLRYGTINDPVPSDWTRINYSKLGTLYVGNMPLVAPSTNIFPASLPSDGLMDFVSMNGDIPRIAAVRTLLAVENDTFFDMPEVGYQKVLGYRVTPRKTGKGVAVSADGERLEGEPWQAEVHESLGTVLSRRKGAYEANGVA